MITQFSQLQSGISFPAINESLKIVPTATKGYGKKVEITNTGMVMVKVYREDGTECGFQHWHSAEWFESNKKCEARAKKAHAWAEERAALCSRQETTGPLAYTVTTN